jgi:KaiC/GvpD/RAD55 family RecA-like ATPase
LRTERVTVLMSPEKKAELSARAAKFGVSTGEYIRLAVDNLPDELSEEEELETLINELRTALPEMHNSLRAAAKTLRDARSEIDSMLREAGLRQ